MRLIELFESPRSVVVNVPISNIINELAVNRNGIVHKWQLRKDDNLSLIEEVPSVILKNVTVAIDHDAYDEGKKVFAYLQGDPVNDIPQGMLEFPIGFQRNSVYPFLDRNTNEPIENIDYVRFDEQGKVTGYKQGVAEGRVKNAAIDREFDKLQRPTEYMVMINGKRWKAFPDMVTARRIADKITAERNITTQVLPIKK